MSCDWLLVDGPSLIFRAYHGVPKSVRAPDGHLVNAVRGFLESLARLVTTRRPARIAVAHDVDWRPAWRVQLIPEYKLHRVPEPVPPALIPQMAIIDAFLDAIGVDHAGVKDYEAEDVIASWAVHCEGTIEIVSGDRDLFALVADPRVRVLYPEKGGMALVDEAEVARRYGIPGRSYADFAILRGDPSDGLPGLRGVGAVAAAGLVRRHGGVAGMLESGSVSEKDRGYLLRALQVVPPVDTIPISLPSGRRDSYPADPDALAKLEEAHGVRAAVNSLTRALDATSRA